MTRLNAVIGAFERGERAFGTFAPASMESALWVTGAPYDGVIYEMEHRPWDPSGLRDTLQWMLNRRQILERGTAAPGVTPICRIPANGGEMNQFLAKQALDMGVFGVVWPHVSDAEQAANAVSACRYPRLKSAPLYEPPGIRGDSPGTAARYWGITNKEYYKKADVWPLDPEGEILTILMIEDSGGIDNLEEILKVPGVGAVLIGEGDLSQELGHPRDFDHPDVVKAMDYIVQTCKAHGVKVGHPHTGAKNLEKVVEWGFDLMLASPVRSFGTLENGRKLTGRG
ncbi:HpcH/HpaI aldolase family protein [Puniceibacterium confluentis]|uniref:HpcH/HpaI aldolase family protein n=1 Tax=Puniceibacterium confluentis TaxID=1958944 RepID=UPI0011B6343E|nr:aldolase/citrate lyase family protein [Puniceibacterium confluentis]